MSEKNKAIKVNIKVKFFSEHPPKVKLTSKLSIMFPSDETIPSSQNKN